MVPSHPRLFVLIPEETLLDHFVLGALPSGRRLIPLVTIPAPTPHFVERAFKPVRNQGIVKVFKIPEPLILSAPHTAIGVPFIILSATRPVDRRIRLPIRPGHIKNLLLVT